MSIISKFNKSVNENKGRSLSLPAQGRAGARATSSLARGQGFEPRLAGPKPAVLPLDDPRIIIFSLCFPMSYEVFSLIPLYHIQFYKTIPVLLPRFLLKKPHNVST